MIYTSKKREELYLVADSVLELNKKEGYLLNQTMESLNRKIKIKVLYSTTVIRDKDTSIESSLMYSPAS